ncbi:iron chaperone [Flavobacterium seoulense]|uniref:YdhG-like domain-containing protein n=1 Tax=Flavobacterium seoulense TaxID=1492738 RepID=A0A066WLD7_9FLAO|nr:DUF1801 domain-containing protein [Flavobacterium seoulense]KDN54822.1 hypothetical protein FEM21_20730 [Flavobacterium seoulense]
MDEVNEYIKALPIEVQKIANKIRTIIKNEAPDVVESISYGMPAYKTFGKPLVYFAAYKNHIGLYATPSGHEKFATILANYKEGKGSVQFPLDVAIPYELIQEIVAFRVKENIEKFKK